jgi:hypothetical protein
VNNGEVTLDGIVDTREAKRMAEDVSESVDGVRDVVNHLKTYRGGSEDRSSQRTGTSTSAGETRTLTGAAAVGSTDKKR